MKAYSIVIENNTLSENAYKVLTLSSDNIRNDFSIEKFNAITPSNVDNILAATNLKWNYPSNGSVLDPWTELRKTAYGERDHKKRVGCSLSHFMLWQRCVDQNEPLLILEHDSVFIRKLDAKPLLESDFGIVGINSPRQATFAFDLYDKLIQTKKEDLQPVPMLTSKEIPQGLPGNSAYIIKPFAAKHLIGLCHKYGLWPNDAIMCQQLCNFLGVSRTYYTRVQGLKSTTTL